MKVTYTLALTAAVLALTACGGGGGGDGDSSNVVDASNPVVVPPVINPTQPALSTYSVQTAYAALQKAGNTVNYTVSGGCTGTATYAATAPTNDTFEGAAVQVVATTSTIRLSSCAGSNVFTSRSFFDANFNLKGTTTTTEASTTPASYGVVAGTAVLPQTTNVVGTTDYGRVDVYTSSNKATQTAQIVLSYSVATETTNTALFALTSRAYRFSDKALLQTQVQTYRIQADGTLKPLTIDLQVAADGATPASRLLLTAN